MSEQIRPNIVFILTDQQRWDCLSISGHPVVRTPNFDELAHRGTVFTAAYSPCPSCIAARASIFTGLSPSSHGRLGYRDCVPWRYENTLAELLSNSGYQTHCVGKTHFFPQRLHMGFQSMESYEALQNHDGTYVNDYHEWLGEKTGRAFADLDHGLNNNSWSARPSPLPEELHNNTWVVTRGLDFLKRRDKTRPFFLNLSFHRPHPPIDPPQAYYDMYFGADLPPAPVGDWASCHDVPIDALDSWHGHLPAEVLDHSRRAYYAQIAHIDAQIGRLLLARQSMKLGPTVFVFTSDHGEMLGDHHMFRKCYAYEGSAAVPMIVAPLGGSSEAFSDAPVTLADVYPTILDMASVPIPGDIDGRSMLGLCDGSARTDWRQFVHGEHSPCYTDDSGMQFLTDGREKYIWFTLSGTEQLFDLSQDPQELRDLAPLPTHNECLVKWRRRMVDLLAQRPADGLSDGKKLIAGSSLPAVRSNLLD